jgi:hypothetical protein
MIGFCSQLLITLFLLIAWSADTASAAGVSPQELDALVRRAEDEGQESVYATDSVANAQMIWNAFQKRYPKIKFVGTTGRGSDLLPKLFGERRAGKFLADVFLEATVGDLFESI